MVAVGRKINPITSPACRPATKVIGWLLPSCLHSRYICRYLQYLCSRHLKSTGTAPARSTEAHSHDSLGIPAHGRSTLSDMLSTSIATAEKQNGKKYPLPLDKPGLQLSGAVRAVNCGQGTHRTAVALLDRGPPSTASHGVVVYGVVTACCTVARPRKLITLISLGGSKCPRVRGPDRQPQPVEVGSNATEMAQRDG